jgi:hypothetical protein
MLGHRLTPDELVKSREVVLADSHHYRRSLLSEVAHRTAASSATSAALTRQWHTANRDYASGRIGNAVAAVLGRWIENALHQSEALLFLPNRGSFPETATNTLSIQADTSRAMGPEMR